jgi:hypothetical protein
MHGGMGNEEDCEKDGGHMYTSSDRHGKSVDAETTVVGHLGFREYIGTKVNWTTKKQLLAFLTYWASG